MSDYIELAKGPTGSLALPCAALELALDLERRDLILKAEGDKLRIAKVDGGKPDLSPEDVDRIRKWKTHLLAIVAYKAPETPSPT